MTDYLGLSTTGNDRDGVMQDVHWPSGAFGYFPSYTLGAMMAAQQWAALEKQQPDVRGAIRRGDFTAVNEWRRENIWRQGSRWSTAELMTKATGEPLNADYFIAHLEQRYGGQ
jgi:carboxypeptidase Taq